MPLLDQRAPVHDPREALAHRRQAETQIRRHAPADGADPMARGAVLGEE